MMHGQQNVKILSTEWKVRVSNPGESEIFLALPYSSGVRPNLLYDGYHVFPGGKAAGRCFDHPPTSSAEGEGMVEVHLFPQPSCLCGRLGRTLPLTSPLFFPAGHNPQQHHPPSLYIHNNITDKYKLWNSLLCIFIYPSSWPKYDGFGGLVVSMLACGTQVCGFKPGRSRWIFFGCKNPQHAFHRRGSKRICPMSQLCRMSKNLVIYVNYGLLAKFQV